MSVEEGSNSIQHSVRWKSQMFSPIADTLIAEIVQLGGEAELHRTFAQFRKELEPVLQQLRDRLMGDAMDRGLEP